METRTLSRSSTSGNGSARRSVFALASYSAMTTRLMTEEIVSLNGIAGRGRRERRRARGGDIIDSIMAQLIVRNLDEALVRELKARAARKGRSAEEEHRAILREALKPERK